MTGQLIGEGNRPLVCTPLVETRRELIQEEIDCVLEKKPDLIEWRADYFKGIADTNEVIAVAHEIKAKAGDLPIILTIRSRHEGGQPIPLSEKEVLGLYLAICRNTDVEYIDYELSNRLEYFMELRRIAFESNTKIIASYHNFNLTPDPEFLHKKFAEATKLHADVVKVAVMSKDPKDVLTLLSVTLEARKVIDIPMISVSMGRYGTLTRMMGGVFGSAVTFAVGDNSSAPGQIPIEDLRTVLGIVQKSIGNDPKGFHLKKTEGTKLSEIISLPLTEKDERKNRNLSRDLRARSARI